MFDCASTLVLYNCRHCNFQTECLLYLKKHTINNCNGPQNLEEIIYRCSICHIMSYSKYISTRHRMFDKCTLKKKKEKDEIFKTENEKIDITSKNIHRFECAKCHRKYIRKESLKRHILARHTESKKINWFECETCKLKFKRKDILKRHNLQIHTNSDPIHINSKNRFECEMCSAEYSRKGYLDKHILQKHTTENVEIQCDKCSMIFKRPANLKEHIIRRHTEPGDIHWFECDMCHAKFKTRSDWKDHVFRRHNPAKNKWFYCDKCPAKYTVRGSLNYHIATQHAENIQLLECGKCGKKFKHKSKLRTHVKNVCSLKG